MEPQFFFLVFITVLLVMISMVKKSKANGGSSPTLPPGPWRLPIIGNIHQLLGSPPHHRLRDLAMKYGPVMRLQLGELPLVVISSAEMAKEVMKTHDISLANRPSILAAEILLYNSKDISFAPYGQHWRELRKITIMELLSSKRVQSFRSIREEEVSFLVESIARSAGSPINLSKMLISMTNSINSRTTFHQLPEHQDAFTPLVPKVMMALGGFNLFADFFPSMKLLHVISGVKPKLMKLHQEIDTILQSIIDEHIARKAKMQNGSKTRTDDLLEVLLNLRDHGNLEFDLKFENIKAVILDLFLAAYETSATVIEWAMSEMLKNPRVLERAQEEVRKVFKGKEKIDEASIHELKYLDLVVKETLRLHPPTPLLAPREAREGVEINGYVIPSKTRVIVNAWAIGRDPKYWTRAETFLPERFLDRPVDYKGKDFEYIPFGAGRRMCPGMLYGTLIVVLALANFLYHFDWKLPNEMNPDDFDMDEVPGSLTARRRNDLLLIPIPSHRQSEQSLITE